MSKGTRAPTAALVKALDVVATDLDKKHLDSDPLRYVHQFKTSADQEVVAFLAAAMAFGKAEDIFSCMDRLLERLGPNPAKVVDREKRAPLMRRLRGFQYKWLDASCLTPALLQLGRWRADHGTIGDAFKAKDPGGDDVAGLIQVVSQEARELGPDLKGFRSMFPLPEDSSCKRFNLFLRWMSRTDEGLDLGLWSWLDPNRLIVPLDTHLSFLGSALKMTTRKEADFLTAQEVTGWFRSADSKDPLKYDWALSRMGILKRCIRKMNKDLCSVCAIKRWCEEAKKGK